MFTLLSYEESFMHLLRVIQPSSHGIQTVNYFSNVIISPLALALFDSEAAITANCFSLPRANLNQSSHHTSISPKSSHSPWT